MTRTMLLAAVGVVLAASAPAMAQTAQEGGDAALEAAMSDNNVMTVRNVTRPEMARGVQVFDEAGKPVGTVERLSGNDVVLTDGSREYTVSITQFFAYNQHGKDYFAVRSTKAALQADASRGQPLAAAQ